MGRERAGTYSEVEKRTKGDEAAKAWADEALQASRPAANEGRIVMCLLYLLQSARVRCCHPATEL